MNKEIVLISPALSQNFLDTLTLQGLFGLKRINNVSGPQGVVGSQGLQGTLNPFNILGVTGFVGTQGPRGIQGPLGIQGSQSASIINTVGVASLRDTINQNETKIIRFNVILYYIFVNGPMNRIRENIIIALSGVYLITSTVYLENVTSINGFIITLNLLRGSRRTIMTSRSVDGSLTSATAILNINTIEKLEVDDQLFVTVFNGTTSPVIFDLDSKFSLTYIHN